MTGTSDGSAYRETLARVLELATQADGSGTSLSEAGEPRANWNVGTAEARLEEIARLVRTALENDTLTEVTDV